MLSVVVAVHNEEACLPELALRLSQAIARARCPAEIILVDDGSSDASFAIIEALSLKDDRVRGVRLSRNEGHQTALLCGMSFARGDVIVTLDADLQHPPELLPPMLEEWRRGFDVVHMRRSASGRRDLARDTLAAAFYWVFNALSDVPVLPGSTDFRLLDRRCVDDLLARRPARGFLRAMVRTIGARQTELVFDSPARFAGASSYTLRRLFALGVRAVLSSSRLSSLFMRARLAPEAPPARPYFIDQTVGSGFQLAEPLPHAVALAPISVGSASGAGAPLR
jgi:dolichol-phosphate mannosyltransferase